MYRRDDLVPYATNPRSENDYRSEYYWLAKKYGHSQTFHELRKSFCGQHSDHSDFFAWFSAFESHLAEIDTSRKEAETYKNFIVAVSLLAESQDPHTARHQEKVSEIAETIAREMSLLAYMVEGIRVAGILHDMGKMFVPVEIVTKSAALTSFEFSIIKRHPGNAYEILKEIDFPWPVAEIVLQHHERLDGSGYPQGLKGNEIRLEARVLAVADTVEAISSHRPYRSGMGIEAALEEIDKDKGVFYDTEVTRACQRSLKGNKGFMADKW